MTPFRNARTLYYSVFCACISPVRTDDDPGVNGFHKYFVSYKNRPATPPRSNKTVHDEGDEMVEMVEFRAEEPAEVIRATPTRQNSVEQDKMLSRQKSDVEILREILHGNRHELFF